MTAAAPTLDTLLALLDSCDKEAIVQWLTDARLPWTTLHHANRALTTPLGTLLVPPHALECMSAAIDAVARARESRFRFTPAEPPTPARMPLPPLQTKRGKLVAEATMPPFIK